MASNYKHTRTVSDAIKVKGFISCQEDGTFITYEKDKEEYTVNILDLFNQFEGELVNLLIATKEETDLEDI